ncbi:hypothetical protein TRIATDRAFT_52286 [Trichoderma atroviride IMI 206040]|uniref:Cytochrome b561 domain-containing protein n=1 Tax=Hypocrea atroviridis (strain ATCC 20476 / IMI 206040) TaxID=452589 RepID=G9NND9_HYPAI|nr:uncharacterized protein TRIATDRAFT_52286 [Trichoderma atroviride IMI 206040]EHK47586.1 hypothetical protein TRIATDRAFT_52286 [Trichoderma atroviride IMI 206040]
MAPAPDQLSSPGSVSYDSDTMVVGDGTWDFTKNTFLLSNLQGTDFDTMRYNGMGNRFSTVHQYHTIILAHGIMAAMVFLFLVPLSVMLARFYTREPAHAMRYHARLGVFSGLLLVAAFILPFFAVGPSRSLSNPHHGIGVAIFVMFVVQLVGGRLIQHIMKSRSLRVTLHNWLGRAAALLGIIQVPLGLTLYGSPKVLFILYAVWMGFLLAVYFVLDYRAEGRHERYIPAGRSEAGNTRITESEYYSEHREHENSPLKWLGPLAAGAGIFALMRGRKKEHDDDRSRARTRSPSMTRSHGPTVISSRPSYFSEKYSDLPAQRSGGGGFFGKALGGAAAAFGAGKVFSNFMDRRDRRDEEYSAVSTETPHRNRSIRAATVSEFNSEYTDDVSTIPPSRHPAPTQTASAYGGRSSSPRRSNVRSNISRGDMMDESEYSSYVSPSRRPRDEPSGGGGFAKGVLATLGVGWFAKKFADRRAKKEEEDRLREEEEMRSGTQFSSRYSNTEYQSPVRRDSRRPPQRRSTVTGTEYSDGTESTFDTQTELSTMPPKGPRNTAAGVRPSTSALTSDEMSSPPRRGERLSMPTMPSDPHGILHRAEVESEVTSLADRPQGRHSSRRQMDSERAAAEAAAPGPQDREHVRLRKVTEEETLAQTSRGRRDSQSSLSALESPTKNRRYRRDDSKRRAESAAESRVESSRVGSSRVQDDASRVGPMNPPNPSLAKGRRGRDSGYNSGQPPAQQSGQPGPSFLQPPGQNLPNPSITSVGSHGTWSGMESEVPTEVPTAPRNPPQSTPHQPPPADDKGNESAADNRRRRRAERRRASGSRPSGTENTYDTSTYDENDMF